MALSGLNCWGEETRVDTTPLPSSWVFHNQFSMISLHKVGLGPRKKKYMNFLLIHWPAIRLMKKKRILWVCSLPLANISNVPIVRTWFLNFPYPSTVTDRIRKLPVILRKWHSPCHPSGWAGKHCHDSLSCRRPLVSTSPGALGRNGRSRKHWLWATMLCYSLFSTKVYMMHLRDRKQAAKERAGCLTVWPLSLVNRCDLHNWAAQWP